MPKTGCKSCKDKDPIVSFVNTASAIVSQRHGPMFAFGFWQGMKTTILDGVYIAGAQASGSVLI